MAQLGFWNLAGNRLYYAAFHMASALLLDKGIVAKTHSGVIHLIGAKFVTQGLLERDDITEEEVVPYMESTELFVAKMESLMTL